MSWYAYQKCRGYHIDIYKNKPEVDEYNDIGNSIDWIRDNWIVDMNEKTWFGLGGKSFKKSIQEISEYPFGSTAIET